MEKLHIEEGVKAIEESAFDGCTCLREIFLPSTLESVCPESFHGCGNIEKVVVADGNRHYTSIDGVLFDKNVSSLIFYPTGKEGDFVLPASVEYLDSAPFGPYCKLRRVFLPNGLDIVDDDNPFWRCSNLEEIILEEVDYNYEIVDGLLYRKYFRPGEKLVAAPAKREGHCVVKEGTKEIGAYAFYGSRFSSIQLPNSIRKIGSHAFADCMNLTEIRIPASVMEVCDESVFMGCENLKEIFVPEHLEEDFLGMCPTITLYCEEDNKEQDIDSDDDIVKDFALAWRTLDAELIIKHLDKSFEYYAHGVWDTMHYDEYVDYIHGEFNLLKRIGTKPRVKILADWCYSGSCAIQIQLGNSTPMLHLLDINYGLVVRADLQRQMDET